MMIESKATTDAMELLSKCIDYIAKSGGIIAIIGLIIQIWKNRWKLDIIEVKAIHNNHPALYRIDEQAKQPPGVQMLMHLDIANPTDRTVTIRRITIEGVENCVSGTRLISSYEKTFYLRDGNGEFPHVENISFLSFPCIVKPNSAIAGCAIFYKCPESWGCCTKANAVFDCVGRSFVREIIISRDTELPLIEFC